MKCRKCHRDAPDDASFCPYCAAELRNDPEPGQYEYAAFISYRHLPRDTEVAKRVQQAIETFKMPHGIAGPGHLAGRLGKCFRDEDELVASHSLPERILDALSKSSSLVVVCSPSTQGSVWVQREVAAFAEMHGRNRVFTVLAEGSSAESIPDYLRASSAGPDGTEAHSANPLAVDLRPEASGRAREETLRLIAAIAGCGFDDLKQRDRARKRKRAAIAAAAAALVVALVAAALAFASNARQEALAAESRKLATESSQLLAEGDRYGAIEKALAALPKSASSNDRPLVPEARTALEDALVIEYDPSRLWIPCYSIDAGSSNTKMAVNPDKGWFAILKPNMSVDFYETLTGRRISTAQLTPPQDQGGSGLDNDVDHWFLYTAGDYLLAVERVENYSLICVEAATGNVAWSQSKIMDAVAVPPDAGVADLFCNGSVAYAGAYRVPGGEWSGTSQFENPDTPQYAGVLPSATDGDGSVMYVGFDDSVGRYDLPSGNCTISKPLGSDVVLSVALADDLVIATSISLADYPENSQKPPSAMCAVNALDKSTMQLVWSNELRWVPTPYFLSTGYVDVGINPHADELGLFGEPAVISVAGTLVQAYALSDGALIYEHDFPETVVGAQAVSKFDGHDYLYVACADGTVYFSVPSRAERANAPVSFSYPSAISESATFYDLGTNILSVARSLEHPERYYVYRTEYRSADTARAAADYSLDELIALAHSEPGAVAQ